MVKIDFENWKKGRVPGEINNFSALLFMLIAKADPANLALLTSVYPEHVKIYMDWMASPEEQLQERRGWDG